MNEFEQLQHDARAHDREWVAHVRSIRQARKWVAQQNREFGNDELDLLHGYDEKTGDM